MIKVLLVEDDLKLAGLVARYLEPHGYAVQCVHDGDAACAAVQASQPDVVVLDLMLPGRDGLQVCRDLRAFCNVPVLMLTARDSSLDHVLGLESGADDYVIKPVEPPVLLARLRALLRRPAQAAPAGQRLQFDRLRICRRSREVELDGRRLDLTTGEFEMLWTLASRSGEVLSRDDLLNSVRGIDFDGLDRSVDMCVSKLRRKLEDDPRDPARIKTVRGQGYLFVPAGA
ncbi:winged helix-turn-helix domain-containing protein [Stenotrophomonas sp. 24(2023)]|uniref:winged helix-turn-helix domain-containing protein n=1 Tax=Stenotrophomonas sp. 24(2023) TaxID=3068324 RepID=UPI0027DEB270|nr:winged helix-turn-helix domain-containing protein [Stenotrophomonas sp. 24(2023)]WMJ69476.1 winged helix-turn-helix domain-containing protein [Stenotrophomonas sp. 24(2023)]